MHGGAEIAEIRIFPKCMSDLKLEEVDRGSETGQDSPNSSRCDTDKEFTATLN